MKLLNKIKNKFIFKVQDLLGITRNKIKIHHLLNEVSELQKVIKERTEYHVDVHTRSNSQVILIGRFRNRDFIKCYNIPDKELDFLINHCKELEKHAQLKGLDAWPTISACIKSNKNFKG